LDGKISASGSQHAAQGPAARLLLAIHCGVQRPVLPPNYDHQPVDRKQAIGYSIRDSQSTQGLHLHGIHAGTKLHYLFNVLNSCIQNGSWRKSYLIGFSSLLSAIHEDTPTIVTDGMLDLLLSMLSKYSDDCIEKQHLQDEKARLKTENKQLRSRVQHLEEAYERLDSMHSGDCNNNNNTPSSERKRKRDEGEEGLETQKESPRDEEKEEETRKKARTEEKEGEEEEKGKNEQKDEEEEDQTVKQKKVEDNEKKEWKRSAERLRRDREFYPPMMGPTGPRSVEDMAGLMQLAMDQHLAERQAGVPPEHSLNDMEDRLAELIEHAHAARTTPSAAFSPGTVPPHFDLSPETIEDFNDQSPDSLLQLWDLVDDSDMRQSPLDEVDVFAHFYSCIQGTSLACSLVLPPPPPHPLQD